MGSDRFLPMNVTTNKLACDPKQRIRQLEVAIEHATAAANAAVPSRSNPSSRNGVSVGTVDVSYPSFEFRETLKTLRPNVEVDGAWPVLDLGSYSTLKACKAACAVLQHYYPDEQFAVKFVVGALAS
jgi:hypothetical protein